MKPACRIIGRERQRLEDLAPNNPISEECWNRGSLPPPTSRREPFSGPPAATARSWTTGHIKANSQVAESLYQKAFGDGSQSVTAAIFWL